MRHCHGADHNVDSMIRRLEGCGGLPTDSGCNLYDVRRTYRRTVAVFYEVSMEWRSLCAPYRFGVSPQQAHRLFGTSLLFQGSDV